MPGVAILEIDATLLAVRLQGERQVRGEHF
jgi:hypothetical protein